MLWCPGNPFLQPASRVVDVKSEALFVTIEIDEIGALPFFERREGPAVIPFAGEFHLDDLSPHISQKHCAKWPCQNARQIDDLDALQCLQGLKSMIIHDVVPIHGQDDMR